MPWRSFKLLPQELEIKIINFANRCIGAGGRGFFGRNGEWGVDGEALLQWEYGGMEVSVVVVVE